MLSGLVSLLVDALNTVIASIAAAVAAALAVLPAMPALPSPPSQLVAVEGWVAWFIPVNVIADLLVFTASMYLLWFGVSILMRWAKAARGNA